MKKGEHTMILLRMPAELHAKAKALADQERRTMTAQLLLLIERGLKTREGRRPPS